VIVAAGMAIAGCGGGPLGEVDLPAEQMKRVTDERGVLRLSVPNDWVVFESTNTGVEPPARGFTVFPPGSNVKRPTGVDNPGIVAWSTPVLPSRSELAGVRPSTPALESGCSSTARESDATAGPFEVRSERLIRDCTRPGLDLIDVAAITEADRFVYMRAYLSEDQRDGGNDIAASLYPVEPEAP
jgi:hypothetical protein